MKFQIPNIHHSKVNRRTHAHTHTHRQTDRQAESNMPFQLFQSWGHKNTASVDNGNSGYIPYFKGSEKIFDSQKHFIADFTEIFNKSHASDKYLQLLLIF